MTNQEAVYAEITNLFGSDPETPEEKEILHHLHDLAEESSHLEAA